MQPLRRIALFSKSPPGSDTLPQDNGDAKRANRSRPSLAGHLVIVLILKIALLTLLWKVFIAPNRVPVNEAVMGAHIAAPHQPYQENSRDRFDGR